MNEKLYVVIPCFNEEEVLRETAGRLDRKMKSMSEQGLISEDGRVIFIDDGSSDRTWEIITQLHDENKFFLGVRLSRNFGQHNSLFAGLMAVKEKADIFISMDADLQDDIEAVDEMVREYHNGSDIVYGVRSSRKKDSFIRRTASENFYRFTKMMGVEFIADHAHYRLMSRRAVEALSEYGEVNLFLPYLVPQLGFKHSIVYYERSKRFAGKTKYSLRKLSLMAVDGITSFSTKPIAMISALVLGSFLAVIAGIVAIIVQKVQTGEVSPWLIVFTSVWAIAVFQLIATRIVGEYIGKTFKETKKRPRYVISENLLKDWK